MEELVAAMAAVLLPDDLLLEILVRVKDAAALFRCATTCKQWCHLIADLSFLRRCWPQDGSYSSSTFVGFLTMGYSGGPFPGKEPWFVPTPRLPLSPGPHTLSSFVPAVRASLFYHAVPLVSRHGLVVVLLEQRRCGRRVDQTTVQLAVCNLLAGTCDMLPVLKFSSPFDHMEGNGYAILTGADCYWSNGESSLPVQPRNLSFFKVVIVGSGCHDVEYSLHVFSSDKGSWSVHTIFLDITLEPGYGLFSDAIVCRGMAQWVFRYSAEQSFHVISLNARTGNISTTKHPFKRNYDFLLSNPCITLAIDGTLALLSTQWEIPQIDIWQQQENQQNINVTSEWLCARTIKLEQLEKMTQGRELHVLRQKCGTLLISNDDRNLVYTIALETGTVEEVEDWPCGVEIFPWDAIAMEIEWPAIFVSRLTREFKCPLPPPNDEITPTIKRWHGKRSSSRKGMVHSSISKKVKQHGAVLY